jgi:dihydrofolate reductase
MRQIISQMMISLDGCFEGPNQEIDWHHVDDEYSEYAANLLGSVDGILFGRVTYQLMANEQLAQNRFFHQAHSNGLGKYHAGQYRFDRGREDAEAEDRETSGHFGQRNACEDIDQTSID